MAQQNTYPTVFEGTVFRPKSGTGKSGKPFIGFALSVYAGKDQEGNYRKGPFVDVTVVGNGVNFGVPAEKARVRVSGFLEEREFKRRDGTPATGLAMTALEIAAVELPQGAAAGAILRSERPRGRRVRSLLPLRRVQQYPVCALVSGR